MTELRIPARHASVHELATRLELSEEACHRAYELAGLSPGPADWARYLGGFLLAIGVALITAGITAFFASNWAEMGHFAKFAWIESGFVAAVFLAWWRGLDSMVGGPSLFVAAFLTGILFAVYGQVYQTGADSYSLFLTWAILILPLAVIGRQQGIWVLAVLLLNLSLIMYWTQVLEPPEGFRLLGQIFGPLASLGTLLTDSELSSATFFLNTVALVIWEFGARSGASWMSGHWFARIVAFIALVTVIVPTLLIIFAATFGARTELSLISPILLAIATSACVWYYRYRRQDLFILTCCALAAILVVTSLSISIVSLDVGSLLALALLLIAQVAAAAWWLRSVTRQWQADA
jgi:uncharacterized membrane protein